MENTSKTIKEIKEKSPEMKTLLEMVKKAEERNDGEEVLRIEKEIRKLEEIEKDGLVEIEIEKKEDDSELNKNKNIEQDQKLGLDLNNKIKKEVLEKLKNTKIGIVNIKEIADAEARKGADAYMTESKKDIKGFKGFFKKIWKHTFFDEFYRQREVNRIKEEILTKDNIYTRRVKDNSEKAHENAMRA